MPAAWRYRGREISAEEIVFIRRLIAEHPRASRRALSSKLCEAWQWKQANGAPRDMVCRGLLLMLHRAGQIELPRVRFTPPNPLARRPQPAPVLMDTTPLHGPLSQLRPFTFSRSDARGMSLSSTAWSSTIITLATSNRWVNT